MKAIVYTKYGPPQVAMLLEVPKPVPKADEVLIKVKATTVNRTDCGFRSANYFIVRFFSGLLRPKHKILGCEFAGIIESTGKSVRQFKAGDKVFGFSGKKFGAHAEYLAMKESESLALMPDDIPFEQAAPLTEGGHYALCDLRAARLKSGQEILINGATGAIGTAAVQLAKHFGANVTAVANTKNVELVKSLGADTVIDYLKEDFTNINERFDLVFDAVGKSSFGKCRPLLKQKGIYISTELGKFSQNPLLALLGPLAGGKRVLFPIPAIQQSDVIFLKELAAQRKFHPVIDRSYPLEEIVAAYQYVETGEKTGNVVINVE